MVIDCLLSVHRHAGVDLGQVVVVDNASSDNSADQIDVLGTVTLIRSEQNVGFGKACNLGSRECGSEWLLFLNPDTKLYPESVPLALAFMTRLENKMVAVCGVQLVDESGTIARSCARFPTPKAMILSALGIDRLIPACGFAMRDWDHSDTRVVDHVIGAFYLVRRSVFVSVGGFDERFFVYLEDLDLSHKISAAGWKTMYFVGASAFHAGGGASRSVRAARLFYSIRSRILYSKKYFDVWSLVVISCISAFVEPIIRLAVAAGKADRAAVTETVGAYKMLWLWIGRSIWLRVKASGRRCFSTYDI